MEATSKIREIDVNEITAIEVFDFDGTLVDTLLPEIGKPIWKEKTGEDWPHRGWWGRKESLDISVFGVFEEIPEVREGYNKVSADESTYKVMMTGRMGKLKEEVENVLTAHDFAFDKYLYNYGGSTLDVKLTYLGKLLSLFPNVTKVTLWDDRESHFVSFKQWGQSRINDGRLKEFVFNEVEGERH